MDIEPTEKEFTALGGLFQLIMTDLKNSAPVWEDFILKASKFHSQLRSTLLASTSFLDSFQKIADMATSTRGATKEIGSTLTRLCLRQRSVEAKLKIFSNAFLEALISPLQEKIEEWKKTANNLDKEHAKEFRRAKQELKKKSSDTLKLQKKVRKVGVIDIRRTLDSALQDVTDKYLLLEEIEKQSVRKALIEERSHFCFFVGYLQPVLESEIAMLNEINHIQEIIDSLSKITGDPHVLPSTSEQVIADAKSNENSYSFHVTPPGSPRSLGSRKSSVCSISSINSSSSGSLKSRHLSYSHMSERKHLNSVTSQDSGFTSQDTLYNNSIYSTEFSSQLSTFQESTALSTPSSPVPPVTSTWQNLQDTGSPENEANLTQKHSRPHTISSAYEKSNHNRPPLTPHTFLPLDPEPGCRDNYATINTFKSFSKKFKDRNCSSQPGTPIYCRPSLPDRAEDKSKPFVPEKSASVKAKHDNLYNGPNRSLPDFNQTPPDQIVPHPIYVNSSELKTRHLSSTDLSSGMMDNSSEHRREFAAVLNEGLLLQSKWIRADHSLSDNECSAPTLPRRCRLSDRSSETLPRSRGSLAEDQILEWQMYNLSVSQNAYEFNQNGNQRRPMSIAGVGSGFLLPRKANTLQRVGSANGPKPPAPVRRSSSITSTSVPHKISEGVVSEKADKPQSLSSGAGEVRYSPNLRELKSQSALHLPQEKFNFSLRHVEVNSGSEQANNSLSPKEDVADGNSIVTDVSDSRARLIQDLNFALQKKPVAKKPSSNEPPPVPSRSASKDQNQPQTESSRCVENSLYGTRRNREFNHQVRARSEDRYSSDNVIYEHISKAERSNHTPTPKPAKTPDLHQPHPQKPRLKECLSQSDLSHCGKDWDRRFQLRNGKASDLPDKEIYLKRSFVVALNARLAEQQRLGEVLQEKQSWHLKNEKNYKSWNASLQRLQPPMCRESLMDQIKRGTRLKRVTCNDRSKPKLA